MDPNDFIFPRIVTRHVEYKVQYKVLNKSRDLL